MTARTTSRRHIAPGNRLVVRDAEWLVTGTHTVRDGHQILECLGLSEIVRDEPAMFLTELEDDIRVLDPAETALVADDSPNYAKSRLYLETLFRNSAPSGNRITVGDRGAMDVVPYQLEPARLALRQPRVRLLIADAVGLGKTIEAGILLSELIRRGRGKRILVVALKSMLTQFQKEMWARFTIPLVRLDSEGIQRVRRHLPTNYNPFSYYDRTIISMDTLKREAEYRYWIEQSYWDVVVVDEAQNVARRGSGAMRHRLADRLADRCDSMIMLSATPHDGKPESFASLMNMLNPTAIGDPSSYTPEDIRGVFIRRHKHDIRGQVLSRFQERSIRAVWVDATDEEERVFDAFERLDLESDRTVRSDSKARGGRILFKTQVEKALFSSLPACRDTVEQRIRRLESGSGAIRFPREITSLNDFLDELARVPPERASKYAKLLSMLRGEDPDFDWKLKSARADRVVIFTERIRTMRWLAERLRSDLGVAEETVATISGEGMSDIEQQEVVEQFGKEQSPVRILVASDVASEGINLHYLSHRMIHFDIPWSLMTFQQRNGRIDRFGQEEKPEIYYLLTAARNETIRGDMRVLELLTEKDRHVHENIGDPGEFTGRYDIDDDEAATAEVIQDHEPPERAEQRLFQENEDFLAALFGEASGQEVDGDGNSRASGEGAAEDRQPSVYPGDYDYYRHAIEFLAPRHDLQVEPQPDGRTVVMTRPRAFAWREKFLPREVVPDDNRWRLTTDRQMVQEEIARARTSEHAWPRATLLWDHHPVAGWLRDSIAAVFDRHEAPIVLAPQLAAGEAWFILTGMIPNQAGQTVLQRWVAVPTFSDGSAGTPKAAAELVDALWGGASPPPNPGAEAASRKKGELEARLPAAVERAGEYLSGELARFEESIAGEVAEHTQRLRRLKRARIEQIELEFDTRQAAAAGKGLQAANRRRKEQQQERTERLFEAWLEWIERHVQLEDDPFILVAAVITS